MGNGVSVPSPRATDPTASFSPTARTRLTDRLRLEPAGPEHAQDLWRLHQDPAVAQWWGGRWTVEQARRASASFGAVWAVGGVHKWMAYDRVTGELVGRGGLSREDPEGAGRLEIGWTVRGELWGRGYGTEIGRAGLAVAFGELDAAEVVAFTEPQNTRSRAVMTRLGLRYHHDIDRGGVPFVLYQLTAPRLGRFADRVADLVAVHPGRPLVIALDGPSAAGTSTLAAVLGPRLAASVVGGDDFYRDMLEAPRWALTAAQGVAEYFDWQRLRREVLEPLRDARPAQYRPYSWRPEGGLADRVVTVEPTPILVLEGVYTARPELRDLVDLAVLVDTPPKERHRRLVARGHGNDAWWSRWSAAEDYYFTAICPPESFDLVVPGA